MIGNPLFQTLLVGIILALVLVFSARKKHTTEILPLQTTQELKGFAILVILLGHVAYGFLAHQTFLFPMSVFAGMGVDLFLFLSGFGLAVSALHRPLTLKEFYTKRLSKIFLSLWIILIFFLALDFLVLHRTYPLTEISLSFFGIFPRADLWQNINSPLWYITFILFYYITFPFIFRKSHPARSGIMFFLLTAFVLMLPLPVYAEVQNLYSLHALAFPLGVAATVCLSYFSRWEKISLQKGLKVFVPTVAFALLVYLGIHSGVGKGIVVEQAVSLVLVFLVLVIFVVKRIEFRFLTFLGRYSHEVYLIHWPLLARYDFFFQHFSAGVATIFSLVLFLGFGFLLSLLLKKLPLYSEK